MAVKTLSIESRMGDSFLIETRIREHVLRIDQGKSGGGQDLGPSPLEMFLTSLAGCIGSIARIVAHQRRIALRGLTVRVRGELDTDVLLGKSQQVRAGFQSIVMEVVIDADLDEAEKAAFLAEVDARCPLSDNVLQATPVQVRCVAA